MMIHRDLNEKISVKQVTKVICNRILGENINSKTREQVGKIKIIRNKMRSKREFGNEGEEGVEGMLRTGEGMEEEQLEEQMEDKGEFKGEG